MEALWDATVATELQKKLGTTSRAQNIECACGKEARPTGWLHRSLVIIRVVGPCIQKLAATRGREGGGRPAPAPHHTSVLGARRGVVARGERVRARLTAKHGRATATYCAWHLHPRQVGGGGYGVAVSDGGTATYTANHNHKGRDTAPSSTHPERTHAAATHTSYTAPGATTFGSGSLGDRANDCARCNRGRLGSPISSVHMRGSG
jgi:hypothetical protein